MTVVPGEKGMPLFWLIVLTQGKEVDGVPDVLGSTRQGPRESLGLLQQVLLWRTGSLPSQ